ncbi:MAG: alpha/beta fold hydrolase [Actinomycetaceae bacterium]|nr:alpha/beta fold hydrolase [Actinomycetaceae bacterium]
MVFRKKILSFLAIVSVSSFALMGCSKVGSDASSSASSSNLMKKDVARGVASEYYPATDTAKLAKYYEQKINWTDCSEDLGGNAQCGNVTVPLDYIKPEKKDITLSLVRFQSTQTDREKVRGSLFVNPGGPGASGMEYAASLVSTIDPAIRKNYDLIGWDPRGVGQSTPVSCLTDSELDEVIATSFDIRTEEGLKKDKEASKAIADKCAEKSGELLPFVGTESTVRDLDVMRELVGDAQLNYLGASYGTSIGARYADMFPHLVGHLVLDGAVDTTVPREEADYAQMMGFETAARKYVEQCSGSSCPLTGDDDEKLRQIHDFLNSLADNPLKTTDGRTLTQGLAIYGIILPLYISQYDTLSMALESAMKQKNGDVLLYLADAYNSRTENGYADNSNEAFWAINCADYVAISDEKSLEMANKLEKNSLTFGATVGGTDICTSWAYQPKENPRVPNASGSSPILVVGTEHDPATPYQWAVGLSKQLENGILVSWMGGEGHTAYGRGSSCVDGVINEYLISDKVPDGDVTCKVDS